MALTGSDKKGRGEMLTLVDDNSASKHITVWVEQTGHTSQSASEMFCSLSLWCIHFK